MHRLRGRDADRPRTPNRAITGGVRGPLCVVPLCRRCHRACDRGELDLLPYLEPAWRAQLAHAVGHIGLIAALRRISGSAERKRPDHLTSGEAERSS